MPSRTPRIGLKFTTDAVWPPILQQMFKGSPLLRTTSLPLYSDVCFDRPPELCGNRNGSTVSLAADSGLVA
jgi:hypothetical protein